MELREQIVCAIVGTVDGGDVTYNQWVEAAEEVLQLIQPIIEERDTLRAKIAEMEQQEPAGWQRLYEDGSSTEDIADSPHVFTHQRPLYALPGAKGEGK